MAGIKIINVLKDDTLAEILELFRQAPSGEVIFVLPKNGKVFRKEDHFAAFAAEAGSGEKTISILSSNPDINTLARKYKFTVMNAGKPVPAARLDKAKVEKAHAVLTSTPPPADADIQDTNEDAFQTDVAVPADERMTVEGVDEDADESGIPSGFHVEEADGTVADGGGDAEPVSAPTASVRATLAASLDSVARAESRTKIPVPPKSEKTIPVPVQQQNLMANGDPDYIDSVWRDRMAAAGAPPTPPASHGWRRVLPSSGVFHGASRPLVVGGIFAAVLALGAAVFFTSGKATVVITPQQQELDEQIQVQVSDAFLQVDDQFGKIPGQLVSAVKSSTATAPATGNRDVASKARGTITVHNEYSSSPQALVATTRFADASGRVFRTLQSVSVPGSTVVEGKPVAGTAQVLVIADKAGPDYNIPAGKFTIVAFTEKGDTERAQRIYGLSGEPMSGGASGPSSVVTQADYDAAAAEATRSVNGALKESLTQGVQGLRVLDEALPVVTLSATARPDDAASEVVVTASASLKTVAFRQDDLNELVKRVIARNSRLEVVPEQLTLGYSDVSWKPDTGVLSFSISVKGPAYQPIDTAAVMSDIMGKNAHEVQEYFQSRENVGSATVSLTPFWARSVPERESKISVVVRREPTPTAP
jgi:hypothetical protein